MVNWRTNEPASKYHLFFNYNLRKAKYLMRYTTFVILSVSFMLLSGCATQGRLTSLTFQQSSSYETLDSSMEKLKGQYEGSLQEQFSALGEMRYISTVSYTHLRAQETRHDLVCRLLLEK